MFRTPWPILTFAVLWTSVGYGAIPATSPSPDRPLDGPTLVTLEARHEPIQSVLEKLSQLSGMNVRYFPRDRGAASPPITLSARSQMFWVVIDDICDQCNGDCTISPDGQVMIYELERGGRPPVCASGPMRMTSGRIDHITDLTAADSDYCTVQISADFEPRFKPLLYSATILATFAEDDNRLSLTPPADAKLVNSVGLAALDPSDHVVPITNAGSWLIFSVRISVPPEAGRRIAILQGKLRLWVANGTETVEADHLDLTKESARAMSLTSGMNAEIEEDREGYIDLLALRGNRSESQFRLDEHRIQVASLWKVDSAGSRSPIESTRSQGWQTGVMHWVGFKSPGPVAHVVADIPIPREVDIPFDFRDLPLP